MADTPMKKVQLGQRPAYPAGGFPGMTYRQWLVGQVLKGLCSQEQTLEAESDRAGYRKLARYAIEIADAACVELELEEVKIEESDAKAP